MASHWSSLPCAILAFSSCFVLALSAPEYRMFFGRVQGVDKFAEGSNRRYHAFYGIPFAQPPTGELRFRAPERFRGASPNNVISSRESRPACLQPALNSSESEDLYMSEDCLHLNIFAPETASGQNVKKVMVWLHGGGFLRGGNSQYTPSSLVTERDVIVAVPNYRLGLFGFLSSGEGDGNYGLMDQVAALEWVRENIGTFGGDPNDVTVFGNSEGAVSASLLSISPKTKGLFSKAILQSGTALNARTFKRAPGDQFDKLARAAGCTPWFYGSWLRSSFRDSFTSCLRRLRPRQLLDAAASLGPVDRDVGRDRGRDRGRDLGRELGRDRERVFGDFGRDNDLSFSPVIDRDVIPRNPDLLMRDRRYLSDIGALGRSFILGFTNNEGLANVEQFLQEGGNLTSLIDIESAKMILENVLKEKFPLGVPEVFQAVASYEYLYPRDDDGLPPIEGLLNLRSDFEFVVPAVKFARRLMEASNQSNVFMYLIDNKPQVGDGSLDISGFSQGRELGLLFDRANLNMTSQFDPTASDRNMANVMQGAWTQFAKTGNPSGYLGNLTPSEWPAYDSDEESFLSIDTAPQVNRRVFAKRMALWTELFRSPRRRVSRQRN